MRGSLAFLLLRRQGLLGEDGTGQPSIWNSSPEHTHCPSYCPQHIPTRPSLSPGNLKIPIWPCNAPCGQSLKANTGLEAFVFPPHRNALPPVFPLIISSPLLRTMQIFLMVQCFWHGKWYWEKIQSYSYNAFTWLLWNQNRKSCILHKPANYFILITAVFYPPESTSYQILLSNNMWTDSLQ